ncbi:hypothetical protein MIMGU_mgv1a020459mg [Erythranthe guttata]|uniref:Adenylate isopentenyltransferase n=1 Tax=Erythranthe guttata TaxID=4155 RepID=A0A022RTJ1_ERYGU|nr:hypothetical protein MIMGU_mgv1a020459mg [Erythranthe guttata]
MRISFSACKPPQAAAPPLVNFPAGLINIMDKLILPRQRRKEKVVVVMGATGTGKSRLSIDLATRFGAEIINSDKMQVYRGLDVVTNKVTAAECRGVPHHLLGIADPDDDFTAADFVERASLAAEEITHRGRLPIIAGGSNSFVKALVSDDHYFRSRYECCFLWVDVSLPVLHYFVSKRVDRMVVAGLVDEARELFAGAGGDYSRGIAGPSGADLLERAVDQIKACTRNLVCCQLRNIARLEEHLERRIHRLNATEALLRHGGDADEAWERVVAGPGTAIVGRFLCDEPPTPPMSSSATVILGPTNSTAAVAAATR